MEKIYGVESSVNQVLVIEKAQLSRITLILVKEKLGF